MDTSPTALFDSYESDFKQIVDSIREKLDGDAKDQQGGMWIVSPPLLLCVLMMDDSCRAA